MITTPDTSGRYSVDADTILCTRCLEVVGEIEEGDWGRSYYTRTNRRVGIPRRKSCKGKTLVSERGIINCFNNKNWTPNYNP